MYMYIQLKEEREYNGNCSKIFITHSARHTMVMSYKTRACVHTYVPASVHTHIPIDVIVLFLNLVNAQKRLSYAHTH